MAEWRDDEGVEIVVADVDCLVDVDDVRDAAE